jgi:hypothetical protein
MVSAREAGEMGPYISSTKMCRVQPQQWPPRPTAKKSSFLTLYFFSCTAIASWIHSHSPNNCKWLLLHTSTLFIHAPSSLFVSTSFSTQSLVVLKFSKGFCCAIHDGNACFSHIDLLIPELIQTVWWLMNPWELLWNVWHWEVIRGVIGSFPSTTWALGSHHPSHAILDQAHCMHLHIVWLLVSVQPSHAGMVFGW